jgi:hypothetical protein
MDREYISQHNVIERYLSGSLTEEELAAFEERCLWCQETLDELEVAERLREGLQDLNPGQVATGGRGRIARLFLSPQWAAAASVLLAASLGVSGYLLSRDAATPPGVATTQVYMIEATRGDDAPTFVVRVAPEDRWVVLVMYPELGRHHAYRAELRRAGDQHPAWQAGDIAAPRATGSLALTLPAAVLRPGDYRLEVTGMDGPAAGATVGEIAFRVAAPE